MPDEIYQEHLKKIKAGTEKLAPGERLAYFTGYMSGQIVSADLASGLLTTKEIDVLGLVILGVKPSAPPTKTG